MRQEASDRSERRIETRRGRSRISRKKKGQSKGDSLFRALVENAGDVVMCMSPRGVITYVSPNWIEYAGEPPEEAVGEDFRNHVHPDDVEACVEHFNELVLTGKEQRFVEYRARGKEGAWRRYVATGAAIPGEDGRVIGCVVTARDVTERLEAVERLKRRCEFEKAVSAISSRLVRGGEYEELMVCALGNIGSLTRASRVRLFTLSAQSGEVSLALQWAAGGDREERPEQLRFSPWLLARLMRAEVVHVPDLSALPEDAADDLKMLAALDIRSCIALPILTKGALTGVLWLDNPRETMKWRSDEVGLLNIFSEILSTFMERKRVEEDAARYLREIECDFQISRSIEKCGDDLPLLFAEIGSIIRQAMERTVPVFVEFRTEDVLVRVPEESDDVEWAYIFPFFVEGRAAGRFCLGWKRGAGSLDVAEAEIKLFSSISERIGRTMERREAQRTARLRQQQLIHADKLASLGRMVAGVAHEINNPTNNIMLNAGLLKDFLQDCLPVLEEYHGKLGEFKVGGLDYSEMRQSLPELFDGILDGAARIRNLVRELKGFSRMDDGDGNVLVDVNEAASTALRMCSHFGKAFPSRVSTSLMRDLPLVRGNPQRVEQVVVNLLENAWRSLGQKEDARIFLRTCRDESGRVLVEVRDEGCGLSEEELNRIAEPFFTKWRDHGGTGLGIPLSIGIVEAMGGSIMFESEVGVGTAARICLPAAAEKQEDDEV